jgi:LysM repeat protein
LTEKTYTTNPFEGKETLKRLKGALRNAPVIGTVADVVDIGKELVTGDYAGAAVATGTALAGITPIGRIASKGAKVIGKKLKKLSKVDESKDSLKAINLTEKDLENWKKDPNNITSTEFKKKLEGREEELQNIAKSYKDNPTDETLDLYRRKVTELNPIKKIETMPDKPSFLDVRGALGIKVDSLAGKKTGIIGLNRNIEDGQRIASRLDINGYTNHNKWVATLTIPKNLIRDWVSKNPTLSPTSYATAVRLKNVDLKQTESLQKKSLDIAAGRAKGPHAVMEGDYLADDPDDIYKYAKKIFESKDKDWIQVGYNPIRAGFFYDRGTGLPIESADEILQVGPLVLAKNAIGGSIRDYMYNKGGLTIDEQTQQAFNQGGYGVAGKFTPDTGVSAAKEKGNFEGFGYKGEAKEAPAETKPYGGFQESVDMSSGGDDKDNKPMGFAKTAENKSISIKPLKKPMQFAPKTDPKMPIDFSETKEMAEARVNFSNVRNALNFDIAKKKSDKEFKNAYDNLFPDVVKSVIDKNYFIREVVSDNKDLGTYKTVWSSNLNEKDNAIVVAQFIAEAIGGNVADIDPTSDDWAWCSAFVDHILSSVGADRVSIAGESYAPVRATNYLNYGKNVKGGINNGKTGDILVLQTDADSPMDHTGFLIGSELYHLFNLKPIAGKSYMLGGNQGNAVNIKPINNVTIESVRRISGITEKDKNQLKKDNPLYDSFTEALDATPKNYQVISGDSLSKIAKKFNTTEEKLQQLNPKITDPNKIFIGQNIKLYNKGGMAMEQQMNLFEEGGMKDDGLDRDPVSGNEIPPGSLAKEVRDDIPAQLSDGEYVVPADVVQYFGVKFFEDIRAEAKRGLAEMEATGRIGGEPVEVDMTMIAFGKADDKKKKKKAEGGMIGYSNGGVADDVAEIEKARTFNPVDYATLGFTPVSPVAKTGQLQQNNITKTVTYYHGETGESRVVTFVNGIVTPPEDVMYTQPPWSTIKPSPTKVQEKKQDRDDSRDPEFISTLTLSNDSAFKGMNAEAIKDKNGNIMNMTKQGYGAVLTSANRLGLGVNEYYNLPMSTKVKLVGQELKSSFGGKVDEAKVDKIIANAAQSGPTFFDRLINFGKSLFGIEDTDTVTKPQRIVKDVEDDNDDNQNISGDLTIKSDDTDLQKASKTASKSVTPGASAKYVGRTDSLGKKLGDVGYKSALRERQEEKQNKAKGGLLQRPKRRNKK